MYRLQRPATNATSALPRYATYGTLGMCVCYRTGVMPLCNPCWRWRWRWGWRLVLGLVLVLVLALVGLGGGRSQRDCARASERAKGRLVARWILAVPGILYHVISHHRCIIDITYIACITHCMGKKCIVYHSISHHIAHSHCFVFARYCTVQFTRALMPRSRHGQRLNVV
jgi:hypothetical protein